MNATLVPREWLDCLDCAVERLRARKAERAAYDARRTAEQYAEDNWRLRTELDEVVRQRDNARKAIVLPPKPKVVP